MSTLLRVDLSETGDPIRAALVHVALDVLAALANTTPRKLRRVLQRNRGALTVVVDGG